jgi:hypothetical protein
MGTIHLKRVHWGYGPAGNVWIRLVDSEGKTFHLIGDRPAMEDLRQAATADLREGPDKEEMQRRAIEAFGQ